MRKQDIESWALRVVDQVKASQPHEDDRVELKSQWTDDLYKTARQIAAHANAARGEAILWLIGVDEKNGVTGASQVEMSDWYKQVESHFDGVAPQLTYINVPTGGETVAALLFETDRAPYVVVVPDGGRTTREVPWRGGNSTRSANRDELLRLLIPAARKPVIQVLSAAVDEGVIAVAGMRERYLWMLAIKAYIVPFDRSRLVIPFHMCTGALHWERGHLCDFDQIQLSPFNSNTVDMHLTQTELSVDSPGMVNINAKGANKNPSWSPGGTLRAEIRLQVVGIDTMVPVSVSIPYSGKPHRWEVRDESYNQIPISPGAFI